MEPISFQNHSFNNGPSWCINTSGQEKWQRTLCFSTFFPEIPSLKSPNCLRSPEWSGECLQSAKSTSSFSPSWNSCWILIFRADTWKKCHLTCSSEKEQDGGFLIGNFIEQMEASNTRETNSERLCPSCSTAAPQVEMRNEELKSTNPTKGGRKANLTSACELQKMREIYFWGLWSLSLGLSSVLM